MILSIKREGIGSVGIKILLTREELEILIGGCHCAKSEGGEWDDELTEKLEIALQSLQSNELFIWGLEL